MGARIVKVADVGEGVAEVEIAEWLVEEGDAVAEDQALVAVMTDKATIEIPAPEAGVVLRLGGAVGDRLAVGAELLALEIDGDGDMAARASTEEARRPPEPAAAEPTPPARNAASAPAPIPAAGAPVFAGRPATAPRPEGEKPLASPAVRRRALDGGIDLRRVAGSGPAGRITHEDLDRVFAGSDGAAPRASGRAPKFGMSEVPVRGLRRKIAERMAQVQRTVPSFTYVEEVDVTALESLRASLNEEAGAKRAKLTILPFLLRAIVRAVENHPQINGHYDEAADLIRRFEAVHAGIATQTQSGLVVACLRHAEAKGLWECAGEIQRLAAAARAGEAAREELSGSTITITSLGALGGIAATPILNAPELAILGVNKIQVLPRWNGGEFRPRSIMNLSSSFDHRFVDGHDAARFVQDVKALLETPARLFMEEAA